MTKDVVQIPDDFEGYDKALFNLPKHYEECVGNVVLSYGMVQDRIEKMASDIFNDFIRQNRTHVRVICVLRGGYRFFNDLLHYFDKLNATKSEGKTLEITIEFIRVKSYVGDQTTGQIEIKGVEEWDHIFRDKHVLIVEDVIESGKTMKRLLEVTKNFNPLSLSVAVLTKKRRDDVPYISDYCGFVVPNRYIVGYAYDFNNHFRDMAHVCYLTEQAKDKYKSTKNL